MSDQYIGKRELEREHLYKFFDQYAFATDMKLVVLSEGESPDFVCERSDEVVLGVELTQIITFDRSMPPSFEPFDPYDAIEEMHRLLEKKERSRQSDYTKVVKETILVLELMDVRVRDLGAALDDAKDDFQQHGFAELWAADFSQVDAYGDIELFALTPVAAWGYYPRPWPERKPYG